MIRRTFDSQVVATLDVTNTTEVIFYFDFYKGRAWANIRRFAKSDKYTGPTRDGIKINPELLPDMIAALEKAEAELDSLDDQEYLRIPKSDSRDFVVHASTYKGALGVDLREWYKSSEGGGWAPQGIRFRAEYLPELINCLKKMASTKIELKELGKQISSNFDNGKPDKTARTDVRGVPEKLKGLFEVEGEDGDEDY